MAARRPQSSAHGSRSRTPTSIVGASGDAARAVAICVGSTPRMRRGRLRADEEGPVVVRRQGVLRVRRERVGRVGRKRVAVARPYRRHPGDDGPQARRPVGVVGRLREGQVRLGDQHRQGAAGVRQDAGEQEVEADAHRVEIGRRADERGVGHLLGRHERGRAHDRVRDGELRRRGAVVRGVEQPDDAEVGHPRPHGAVARAALEQHVGGLDVAVDDAERVHVAERLQICTASAHASGAGTGRASQSVIGWPLTRSMTRYGMPSPPR